VCVPLLFLSLIPLRKRVAADTNDDAADIMDSPNANHNCEDEGTWPEYFLCWCMRHHCCIVICSVCHCARFDMVVPTGYVAVC
jgi:hypothetical protein